MADEPAAPAAPPTLALDMDRLTFQDLMDAEDFVGAPFLPLLARVTARLKETDGDMLAALLEVPMRATCALLGIARRMTDPEFGPERWATIRLTEVLGPATNGDAPGGAPVPPTKPAAARAPTPGGRGRSATGGGGAS